VADETDVYRADFEAFVRACEASDEPGWLTRRRREAIERFARLGFPTTRDEAWRFTSVARLARASFRRPVENDAAGVTSVDGLAAFGHPTVVFVNGRPSPELSSLDAPVGVQVRSLRDALARDPARLEARLGRIAADEGQAFTSLNTAFAEDGALVEIAAGAVVAEPIHLVFLTAGAAPIASHPRVLVVAGRRSQATLVETSAGRGEYFANAVTEIVLDDGAVLDHYTVQREAASAFRVSTLAVEQGRDSRFSDLALGFGGELVRNDVYVRLAGEGAECALLGLLMAGGDQHLDTHTRIDHAAPSTGSREVYKGILDGRGRGVFHGTILVRRGAQKTDAYQVNKNLLLSREALVNSTPALEIFADDVKCKHGSTTGQLDANALFYLRSRGLTEDSARSLLVHAFAAEIVGRIRVPALRAAAEAELRRRLPGNPEEAVA
jgi:Fe-S cluster assembly protein SufD